MAARSRVIVVGFDGSDVSQRALESAADLVGYGSTLTVVGLRNGVAGQAETALAYARERLRRRGILASYLDPGGDAPEQLVAAADRLDADVIVLGWRAWTGAPSQACVDRVLRDAQCDVLLVR
jgi:nucleotide-binding universal stress UspA family protein